MNLATPEEPRRIFHVGDKAVKEIVEQRPYRGWEDFRKKNPGFSDAELTALQSSGVVIGGIDITWLK